MNVRIPGRIRRVQAVVTENLVGAVAFCRRMTPAAVLAVLLVVSWGLGGAASFSLALVASVELVSLCGLALVLMTQPDLRMPRHARWPLGLLVAFTGCVCLQLLPLPWGLWSLLPGRATAAEGLALLQLDGGLRPLSLAPEETLSAVLKFIPAAAVFLVALSMPWRMLVATLRWTTLFMALASVGWAIAQVLGLTGTFGERGAQFAAAGPFSNENHQVSFLLMCLPFIFGSAGLARQQADFGEASHDIALVWASGGFIVAIGIMLGGSLFGYLMAPFVIAGSIMVGSMRPHQIGWRTLGIGIALSLVALFVVLLTVGLDQLGSESETDQSRSRSAIFATTSKAIADYAPFGSGLGTFDQVYPLYERGGAVPETYVNAAHNEYLQLALELGIPGMLVIAVLVIWVITQIGTIWLRRQEYGSLLRMKMAAGIALLVPLLHSLLDYPLRSPGVACFAAACLAVLVAQRSSAQAEDARASSSPADPAIEET